MDYHKIRASVELIVGVHTFILIAFENSIRDTLSADIQAIFTNSISISTIQNSIRSALICASNTALAEFERTGDATFKNISGSLWNPLVSAFSELNLNSTPPRSYDQARKVVQPKVKPSTAPLDLSQVDVPRVRERLRAVILTKSVLYKNVAHKHIKCEITRCAFCKDLFQRTNITKCEGHKPCHSTGYYPHVGTALWSMVKTKHNKGQLCSLPKKTCEPHELPAILNSIPESVVTEQTPVSEAESESEEVLSSPQKRARSRASSHDGEWFSWSDNVEDFYKRRAGSSPASNSN